MPAHSRPPHIGVEGFSLERNLPVGTYPLTKAIHGLDNSPPIREMYPSQAQRKLVLMKTMVTIVAGPGYMRIDSDATILIAQEHLRSSDERVVYLDFIHELVHLKQAKEGRILYGGNTRYVDKDTEIEAYKVGVDEGRRIDMSEAELQDYLEVPWITEDEHKRLLNRLGVEPRKNSV
jgi:hypothetical protein